jgi:creatinine amidohydrolase/Fe(II)-dependent formamide hydrolase-like protein
MTNRTDPLSRANTRRGFLTTAVSMAVLPALNRPASSQTAPPAQRDRRKYEELLPEEFYEEQKRAPIIYLPIGAMEEHGLQSVLAVDPWTAYEVCLRAARRSGGIVHPILPVAPAGHPSWSRQELRSGRKDLCAPSVWVSRETCRQLYLEMLEAFADLGFQACVAYSGHWPGDALLLELQKEYAGVVRGMKFWGGGTVTLMRDVMDEPLEGGHGMMWETSVLMGVRECWVDLTRVDAIQDSPLSHQLKGQPAERLQAIKKANAAYGNRMLDLAAQRLAKLGQALLE